MSNPGRMQRRWMCLSEVEQYCLNSLTPQRSEMQKSRPRRTGELASMSASAAESTDCTAAALGAVERFPMDSRLVVRCATYNNQQPHFHPEPRAAYARGRGKRSHRAVYRKHLSMDAFNRPDWQLPLECKPSRVRCIRKRLAGLL
jgi:hypothetical protein